MPAYNEARTIAETIASIQQQSRVPDQIIVVDDCSSDQTGAVARALGVQVIRPQKNQGTKAQAQNVALPQVETDLVVTVDADTTLGEGALDHLVRAFELDPNLTMASGYMIPRYTRTVWERGRLVEYLFAQELFKPAQASVNTPVVVSGCFCALRTTAIKSQGGFDSGTMAEDLHLTWKLQTVVHSRGTYVEKAVCYPVDPPTWSIYIQQVDRWSRAFFQNIRLFWKSLHKKPMLAAFVAAAVLDGFLFPLVAGVAVYAMVAGAMDGRLTWVGLVAGLDVAIVATFTVRGGIRMHCLATAVMSIPFYYLLRAINVCVWWRSLFLEIILRRHLNRWRKGH